MIVSDPVQEQVAIGLMLNNYEAAVKGVGVLEMDDFSEINYRITFQAIANLVEKHNEITIYSVNAELAAIGKVFSVEDLVKIEDPFYFPEKFDNIIEFLVDRKNRRKALKQIAELKTQLEEEPDPFTDLIKSFSLEEDIKQDDSVLNSANYIEARNQTDIDKRTRKSIKCGYPEIDNLLTYKFAIGEISIIAARPQNFKCLKFNSLIKTTTGEKEIRNIEPGDKVVTFSEESYIKSNNKVLKVLKQGRQETFKMKIKSFKYEIEATANHPFLTLTGWKELKDLKPGDSIISYSKFELDRTPSKYTPRFCRLIGYLLGDGCITKSIRFTSQNPNVGEDIKTILSSLYGDFIELKLKGERANKVMRYGISKRIRNNHTKNPLIEELKDLNLYGKDANDKHIPEELLTSRENIRQLIIGLWETDGGLHSYSSNSLELVTKLQTLLLYFGIISNISFSESSVSKDGIKTKTGKVSKILNIYDRESYHYLHKEIIAFMTKSPKKRRMQRYLEYVLSKNNSKPKVNNIPCEMWNIIEEYIDIKTLVKSLDHRRSKGNFKRLRSQRISRPYLTKIRDELKNRGIKIPIIDKILETYTMFLVIESIESTGINETYDLHIEGNHNFFTNNILVHNSGLKSNFIKRMCQSGIGVVSYALEQTLEVEADRMEALVGGLNILDIADNKFWKPDDFRWIKIREAREEIATWNYHLIEGISKTSLQISSELRQLKKEGVQIVFFDLFDRLGEISGATANKAQAITRALQLLLAAAKTIKIHICLLVQINRDAAKRKDKRPQLSDLKDSGGYEEFARLVLLLHYPRSYDESIVENDLEVKIAKQNNGPLKTLILRTKPEQLEVLGSLDGTSTHGGLNVGSFGGSNDSNPEI